MGLEGFGAEQLGGRQSLSVVWVDRSHLTRWTGWAGALGQRTG